MTTHRLGIGLVMALLLATGLSTAGCGSGEDGPDQPGPQSLRIEPPEDARHGGELTVIAAGDVDSLDPGSAINQFSFMIAAATQRRLLTESPSDARLVPDIARALPTVDRERGTMTFRLRPGVRFSPPVSREVRAADFKYALERLLMPGVASGNADVLLEGLVGVGRARRSVARNPGVAPRIAGISTPHPMVLRLRFKARIPPLATDALTLPSAAPVPPDYARPLDAIIPSRYSHFAVSSGPYMVENDDSGRLTGHQPGTELRLTRNPNWDQATDRRPAFLDRIRVQSGYVSVRAASQTILNGKGMISGDFAPDPVTLRQASERHPDQLMMAPAGSVVFASLNTTVPPLDSVAVRRAVVAATDRTALQLVRGGSMSGPLATHFIPPGVKGFKEAGGRAGPGFDFLAEPSGDAGVASAYMRRGGYPSGEYPGEDPVRVVTDTTSIGRRSAEIVRQGLSRVGIRADVRAVSRDTMYTGFCNVPAAEVAICPNVGLVRLFNDAQTMLVPGFSGYEIKSVNNSNWSQLDVPAINAAMREASRIESTSERAAAWGRIDRMITAQAPAIPIAWSEIGLLSSSDVVNVFDPATATSDLSSISLTDVCGEREC